MRHRCQSLLASPKHYPTEDPFSIGLKLVQVLRSSTRCGWVAVPPLTLLPRRILLAVDTIALLLDGNGNTFLVGTPLGDPEMLRVDLPRNTSTFKCMTNEIGHTTTSPH
jgi:hypothetical protein